METVSVRATLIAADDVSEDAVYELVKAMFDNQEELVKGHEKFNNLKLEDATKGIDVKFHPGAVKFFKEKGIDVAEDAGRGWRQVVASPKPVEIVEIETVRALMNAKHAVIAAGGGGIPVVWEDKYHLKGVPAVIDKDFASECMAEQLDADMLIILTAVEKVAINFGKPDQKGLDDLTPADARKYIEEKQFAPGSMLPKVQAALSFAESKPGRVALITLLEKAADGISGKTGTRVHQ